MIYSWRVWWLQHNTVVCIHCTIGLIYYSLQVWHKPDFDCRLVGHSLIWGVQKIIKQSSSLVQTPVLLPWARQVAEGQCSCLSLPPDSSSCPARSMGLFCSLLFVDKDSNTRHHLWANDLQIRGNARPWKNLIPRRREMLTKAELPFGK